MKKVKKSKKKGFTLMELLAVIVVLAVIMLIASTAVIPTIQKANQRALGTEGLALIDAAKTAYQMEQMKTGGSVTAARNACFDMQWLKDQGYYTKGTAEGYAGSVYISSPSSTTPTYTFWISNGTYAYTKVTSTEYSQQAEAKSAASTANASDKCGGSTATSGMNTSWCHGTGSNAKCEFNLKIS